MIKKLKYRIPSFSRKWESTSGRVWISRSSQGITEAFWRMMWGLLMLFVCLSCGRTEEPSIFLPPQAIQNPSSSSAPSVDKDEKEELLEEDEYYAQGETINATLHGIASLEELGQIFTECRKEKRDEYRCETVFEQKTKEMKSAVILSNGEIHFKGKGQYLVNLKRIDGKENIVILSIGESKKNDDIVFLKELFSKAKLDRYRDSLYATLSHLELKPVLENYADESLNLLLYPTVKINWNVQGGRYHFLDEGLNYFSKLSRLQKSIIFREKKKYEVSVDVLFTDGKKITKALEIDLSKGPFQEMFPTAYLTVDRAQININEPVKIVVDTQNLQDQQLWQVRKISYPHCPKEIYQLEFERDSRAKLDLDKLCHAVYEEELVKGIDYDSNEQRDGATFIFKTPGKYELSLLSVLANGELMNAASKRLTVGGTLISQRR